MSEKTLKKIPALANDFTLYGGKPTGAESAPWNRRRTADVSFACGTKDCTRDHGYFSS